MIEFNISRPDGAIKEELITTIDDLTKPKGALGQLEELALQIGIIQQTTSPELRNPHSILFAADHGIVAEGVSLSPREVTWQQVSHFVRGGGGISFLCRQHGFKLKIVDAGVDYDFEEMPGLIDRKVRKGTSNYLNEPAMSEEEMELCLKHGANLVRECHADGCNIISFGEMGIGNTSSSSLWMTYFTDIPLELCVGAGSGLDNEGVKHKYNVLKRCLDNYTGSGSATSIIQWFGGFEMVMAVGAMLQAAELGMVILIDGFIMTNCLLAASQLYPAVTTYALFGHQGDEAGHRLLLNYLEAKPILRLDLRLGEGTGAVCAYPIVDSAVRMMREMGRFNQAEVTRYF